MKKILALILTLMFLLSAAAETYSVGSRGDEVKQAQVRLKELGYLSDSADGIYGKKTAAAVSLFQQSMSLEDTGKLDETTWTALFDENAEAVLPTLNTSSKGEAVIALQQRLIELGFMEGKADGDYGKITAAAVKAYQNRLIAQGVPVSGAYAITASGEADNATQKYLFDTARTTFLMNLSLGMNNDEVIRVENRLSKLGWFDGSADENYDDYTERVVKAYQAAAGMEETGIADRDVVDALFGSEALVADHCVLKAVNKGDMSLSVTAVQNAMARYGMLELLVADGEYGKETANAVERFAKYLQEGGVADAALFADGEHLSVDAVNALYENDYFRTGGDIKKDSASSEIKRVQRRLMTLWYQTASNIDGIYGKQTKAALEAFQTANGLEVTGIADEATQRVLFSAEAIENRTPWKIGVSIAEQRVYVYKLNDAGEYEQMQEFICSTGLGNATPKGVFLKTRPLERWHYFTKFNCWAQYTYQIEGAILFHSVLYSQRDVKTLRQASVWALGSKASHGCVRLMPEDAQYLFENCPKGTIVVVY